MLDSFDEELELELDDERVARELRDIAALKSKSSLDRRDYFRELFRLQSELIKLQDWVAHTGSKVAVIFEGRDAAGKGGVIKRITQRLNPRSCRVVALPAPTEREKSSWYFQRYVPHLPAAGEIVLFDRSWYNRAGVERVMGFCTPNDYLEFMREAPELERMMVRAAARRRTSEEQFQFGEMASAMERAAEADDEEAFLALDKAFNELVGQACRNPFAESAMEQWNPLSRRFWFQHHRQVGDLPRMAALHADIAWAIGAGDPDEAGRASDVLLSYLTNFTRAALDAGRD